MNITYLLLRIERTDKWFCRRLVLYVMYEYEKKEKFSFNCNK